MIRGKLGEKLLICDDCYFEDGPFDSFETCKQVAEEDGWALVKSKVNKQWYNLCPECGRKTGIIAKYRSME
jgi:CDP-diacylglycerol pyrophosphatase